jgi:hypothetical protein
MSSNDNLQDNKATSLSTTNTEKDLNGWSNQDGEWNFYKSNEKQTGWIQDKNLWYYLGNDGKMRTGWIQDKSNWYYLNSDGSMATNTTVDGCYLNTDGQIQETPSNYTKQNNASQNNQSQTTQSQDSPYKSSDPYLQKILGKWKPQFFINMGFIRVYNSDYINITTTKFQIHPYTVVHEDQGYIDIQMQDSNVGYRFSFDLNGSLHVTELNDTHYTKEDLYDITAESIHELNVCTFTRYE